MRQWINLMEHSSTDAGHEMIDAFEKECSSQPWWTSRKRADTARRSYILTLLGEVKSAYDHGKIDANAVRRILDRAVAEKKAIIVGRSIGYKYGRDLRWVDVPGIVDPIEASKKADTLPTVQYLKLLGYREYGITPMIDYIDP